MRGDWFGVAASACLSHRSRLSRNSKRGSVHGKLPPPTWTGIGTMNRSVPVPRRSNREVPLGNNICNPLVFRARCARGRAHSGRFMENFLSRGMHCDHEPQSWGHCGTALPTRPPENRRHALHRYGVHGKEELLASLTVALPITRGLGPLANRWPDEKPGQRGSAVRGFLSQERWDHLT